MSRFLIAAFVTLAISPMAARAQAKQTKLLPACEAQLTAKFKQWRFVGVTADVADWAKSRHENPTIVSGDFDGNGRTDVALLIQDGPARRLDSLHIAVCLDLKTTVKLYVIDKPYCSDGITRAAKGEQYYDFGTDMLGTYSHDGVSTYCFEKAGATYQFENGAFRMIVDSD